MKRIVLLVGLFLLSCTIGYAQNVLELIAEGDQLAVKEFKNEKALEKFLQADKLSPNNVEVLWRLSRTYIDIGEHMPASTDAQKQAQLAKYKESLNYANKAVKAGPDKSVSYLRRAIANGRIALFMGVFEASGVVNEVKTDIDKALKLGNGGNDIQAAAHYVIGRTHAKLSEKPKVFRWPLGLGWGSIDDALTHLSKAVEMRPNFRMYRLEYAKALIKEDEFQKAKEQLSKIPYLGISDEDDEQFAAEAKSLYEQVKNK